MSAGWTIISKVDGSTSGTGSPVAPGAVYSVALTEVGPRTLRLSDSSTWTTLQVVILEPVAPGGGATPGTVLHLQISSNGGTTWGDLGTYAPDRTDRDGTGNYYKTTISIPNIGVYEFDQPYLARAWAANQYVDQGPSIAVASATCTVAKVGLPSSTGATISISAVTPRIDPTSGWQWWEQTLTVQTAGAADPDTFVYQVSVQQCDAAGNPGPSGDPNADERPWKDFQNDGSSYVIGPLQGTYVDTGSPYHYTLYRVYAVSRTAVRTTPAWKDATYSVPQKWPGGATSSIQDFGTKPSGALDLTQAATAKLGSNVGITPAGKFDSLNSIGSNLLNNPGFEQDLLGWSGAGFQTTTAKNHTVSGARSLTLSSLSGGPYQIAMQLNQIAAGDAISFGAWLTADSGTAVFVQLIVDFYDQSYTQLAQYNVVAVVPTTAWQQYSGVSQAAPANTAFTVVTIYCSNTSGGALTGGTANIYIDDCTAYRVAAGSGLSPTATGGSKLNYGSNTGDDGTGAITALNSLGGNILNNPGFEQGLLGWTINPVGAASTTGSQNHTTSGSHSGTLAANGTNCDFTQQAPARPGEVYRTSAWVMSAAGAGVAVSLYIGFLDATGSLIGTYNLVANVTPAPSTWLLLSGVSPAAPTGTASVKVYYSLYANPTNYSGTNGYLDDCKLELLPSTGQGTSLDTAGNVVARTLSGAGLSFDASGNMIVKQADLAIANFSGYLDVSRVTNLSAIAIGSFSGNLDVSRVNNIYSLTLANFVGTLDISRIANIGTLSIGNFSGTLDVSRVGNLLTINIGSFAGNLDAGRISNLTVSHISGWDGASIAVTSGITFTTGGSSTVIQGNRVSTALLAAVEVDTSWLALGTGGYNSPTNGAATMPANPAGFFLMSVNGASVKVPYFNI